jgi:hypothetical protein
VLAQYHTHLDALEYLRRENVEAGVYLVRHELLRFLDEFVDLACVNVVNNHAIFGRLFNFGHNYGALATVVPMEQEHFNEREVANDVAIEYEKRLVVFQMVARQS